MLACFNLFYQRPICQLQISCSCKAEFLEFTVFTFELTKRYPKIVKQRVIEKLVFVSISQTSCLNALQLANHFPPHRECLL